MKSLLIIFFLTITPVTHAALYVDFYQNAYSIRGDIAGSKYYVTRESKASIKSGSSINWPTKDGVWLFPLYKKVSHILTIDPIYLAPPLINSSTEVESADLYLDILSRSMFAGGVPLINIDTTTLADVGALVCDYKVNTSPWRCKGAKVGSGLIETPKPPEPPLSCSIAGSIDLRHAEVTLDNVANNRATTTAFVSCNRSANVSIAIAPDKAGRVKLNGVEGLYSLLSVEGVGSGRSYSFTAGTGYRSLTFASVLETNGNASAGAFSGSALVVLTIP
ncbi:hypothetical protein [Pseudomonas fluorescens]|uniref:MrpH family fimbial adhesin n=1 Tax=Pseudomonas fluorescens TaxID=294 RepID=UPI000AD79E8D|nr:hypothetical protein [Pseudomonas fluorescens]